MAGPGNFGGAQLKQSVKSYATFKKSLAQLKTTDLAKTMEKPADDADVKEAAEKGMVKRTDLKLMQNAD